MTLNTSLKSIGAILAGFSLGSSATAVAAAAGPDVFVSETGLGVGQASGSLTLPVGTNNFWAGSQTISVAASSDGVSPTSFLAYCVDPAHYSTAAFTPYLAPATADSLATAFPTQAAAIQSLFDQYYAGTMDNASASAAFQLALWELANDDGNLSTGSVQVNAGTSPSLIASASAMLNGPSYLGPNPYYLTVYRVDREAAGQVGQDYIVASTDSLYVTAIPEPASAVMVVAGLVAIGLGARGRRAL